MNFNKLYESIFQPASKREVEERKNMMEIEKFKDWMKENGIKYKEDSKGNLVDVVIDNLYKDEDAYLHFASQYNRINMVKLLLDKGADVNKKTEYGKTPLHYACIGDNLDMAKFLIDNGADVNAKDDNGETSLHIISKQYGSNTELIKLLIDNGADINSRDNKNRTPLYYAKNKEVRDLLRSKGAKR